MRIAYGVHGYSLGHATRAGAVIDALTLRHQVQIFAGGDALAHLTAQGKRVTEIPSLGFAYARGRRSNLRTLMRNLPLLGDLSLGGRRLERVIAQMKASRPDVLVSDAEPWTHAAARRLGIPRIGFDHFGVLVYCKVGLPLGDRLKSVFDRAAYRALMGRPQRVLVSSFFDAQPTAPGIRTVGPVLREAVHRFRPGDRGHLLVYLNQGTLQLTDRLLAVLQSVGRRVLVYGTSRRGRLGSVHFRPAGNLEFLRDLADSHAVISTAGNQLVGEAMHFGKPMLVMPERCVEQRLTAAEIVRLGVGEEVALAALSAGVIERFLGRAPAYARNARARARDGRRDAVEQL
ncbi:MAG: hypothetical protein IT376_22580, partial [Polyangiaceae bacterium]|nr:hypothetical protein [Polyangiaceae bacterium]